MPGVFGPTGAIRIEGRTPCQRRKIVNRRWQNRAGADHATSLDAETHRPGVEKAALTTPFRTLKSSPPKTVFCLQTPDILWRGCRIASAAN